jgi:hypothetical protein
MLPFQVNFFLFFPSERFLRTKILVRVSGPLGLARPSCKEYSPVSLHGTSLASWNALIDAYDTVAFAMDHVKEELIPGKELAS